MVSFIIPYIGDRVVQFRLGLASIEKQTDKDWEIICVDHNDTNPAIALNWGVEQANGDIICLTSPEVIHAHSNVKEMKKLPLGCYWLGRCVEEEIENLPFAWDRPGLSVNGKTRGLVARCTEDSWASWKYFIGVLHKSDYWDIGGMDERFANGIAWEDRDFGERAEEKLVVSYNPDIVGIHLPHTREYQEQATLREKNRAVYVWRNYGRRRTGQHKG